MRLCLDKRGELLSQQYVSGNRVELHFMIPLGEIVIDFYDKLKSISKGYASFDYHIDSYRPSKLAKLDILLNSEPVDALSTLTHESNAVTMGRRMCEKLELAHTLLAIAIVDTVGRNTFFLYGVSHLVFGKTQICGQFFYAHTKH